MRFIPSGNKVRAIMVPSNSRTYKQQKGALSKINYLLDYICKENQMYQGKNLTGAAVLQSDISSFFLFLKTCNSSGHG